MHGARPGEVGRQVRSWYLSGKNREMLDRMGYKKRLKEKVEVDLWMVGGILILFRL